MIDITALLVLHITVPWSGRILLLGNVASLGHLHRVPGNLGFLFFADAIPVARNMLVAEQRANFFEGTAFGFLWLVSVLFTYDKRIVLTGNRK